MANEAPIAQAFVEMGNLCIAAGAAPLSKHEGCWEHQVDERWWIAVNGHAQPEKRLTSKGIEIQPFHCYVEYNGWPAGILSPYGGVIAAGTGANEDTFIEALKLAAKRFSHASSGDVK